MKYAVIYARYSSEKQNDQSIEGQLTICNDYAQRNDITVVKNYIDRATTGTNDNRPAFQEMLHDCSTPVVWDIVLVYAIDRFGRNSIEIAVNKQKLKKNNKTLISATQRTSDNIDGSKNLDGILLENMYIGLAEYYSAELSQKVKRGITESRKKGLFCGGHLPYGYRVKDKKVYVNEEEAEIIRYIFKQYWSGVTTNELLKEITNKGIFHRGKPFTKNTFYYLLRLEKYTGVCHDRKTGEMYDQTFPAILPKELFYNVQKLLGNNKLGGRSRYTDYLLRKKIFCGYCGKFMQGESGTCRNGEIKHYYKCSTRKANRSCNKKTLKKELIEKLVIDTTFEMLTNPNNLDLIINKLADYHETQMLSKSTYNILIAERDEVKKSLQNIIKAVESGLFNNTMRDRMSELEKTITELEEKIATEECNQKNGLSRERILQYIETALIKEPRIMINHLIQKIIVFDDKIEIYYKYTDNKNPHNPTEECGDFAIIEFDFLYIDGKVINNDEKEANKKGLTGTLTVQIRPMWLPKLDSNQ